MSKEKLDTFEGWENATDIDFFGEAPTEEKDDVAKVIEAVENADLEDLKKKEETAEEVDGKKKPKTEVVEDPEHEFFGEKKETPEGTVSTETEEEEEDEEVAPSSKSVLTFLKDKKLVDYELEEGEELTDDLASEILEDSYDDSVEERVKGLMKDLPDTVKNLITFATSGGNVDAFISQLAKTPTVKITDSLDLEDEDNQRLVIRTQKAIEGEDNDTTESYIEFLKESGKLKATAEKTKVKIVKANAKTVSDAAENTKASKLAQKERQRDFKAELTEFIGGKEEISSMTINKIDKRKLPSYIADRNVKLEDGKLTTAMQRDLIAVLQDKDRTVILAKLLKNNFDFSEIIKAEKTKYSKEVKQGLSRSKGASKRTTKGSSHSGTKTLADYFN